MDSPPNDSDGIHPARPSAATMWGSFKYFFGQLVNERGESLKTNWHHIEWCDLLQGHDRLCLLAPRDHGKSWTCVAYLLWRCWRHNRDPLTGLLMTDLPEGKWEAVIFSESMAQAESFFEVFQSLMLANERLFSDILPDFARGRAATIPNVWSRRRTRLKNRAQLSIRSYQTSTRGLHPDLILCDDVLSDKNTASEFQRAKAWKYFVSTLLPMNPKQIIIVGTAFHYDDVLHRLKPPKGSAARRADLAALGIRSLFEWQKYRSYDPVTHATLWLERYSYERLMAIAEMMDNPALFNREYQNDPRADTSSMFPYSLTTLLRHPELTFVASYMPTAEEVVVFGMDVAISAEVGADFTVLLVAALNRNTQERRLLMGFRLKGLGFREQVQLIRDVCRAFNVALGLIEENGFQKWLKDELSKYPETATRVLGHKTGTEKSDLADGVPAMKIVMQNRLWQWPFGDEPSISLVKTLQAELAAYGWKDGKLQGVGEHDDTVMALWFTEKAARTIESWLRQPPVDEMVTAEDYGVERVQIGPDYDDLDGPTFGSGEY